MKRRLAAYVGLALLVWGVLWAVGRSAAVEAERQAVAEMHERNAEVALRGYRASRRAIEAETRKREAAERRERVAAARLHMAVLGNMAMLDSARTTLADSAASAAQLRANLANLVITSERLVNEVSRYRADADSLVASFHAERSALLVSLALADSTIAAQAKAITAWKQAAECRVKLLIVVSKCPTRTQVAVGGFILGGLVVVAAK